MIDKELNKAVYKGIKMGKKRKRSKSRKKVGVSFLLLILFIGASRNPTFAEYIKKVPLISNLYAETESINEAKKHGMVQYVNKSVENNGVRVTIDSIQLYGERWTVEYTIEDLIGDKKFGEKDASFNRESMSAQWDKGTGTSKHTINTNGDFNRDYAGFYNQEIISAENNKIKRKFDIKAVYLLNKYDKIPDRLVFDFDGVKFHEYKDDDSKYIQHEGKWNFVIYIDKEKFDVEPITLAKNKVIDINGLKLNMEKLESYPTYTKMVLNEKDFKEINKVKVDDIKGLRLVSENKVYDLIKQVNRDQVIVGNENTTEIFKRDLYFKSVYFDEVKELKLLGDGGVVSSKNEKFIEYDVFENKLNSNGLSYSLENELETSRGVLYVDKGLTDIYSLELSSEIDYIPEFFDSREINSRYSMIDFIIDDNGNIFDWAITKKEVSDKLYYNIDFIWCNTKGSVMENGRLKNDDKKYSDKDFVKPNKIYIYLKNPIKGVLENFEVEVFQ